MENDLFVVAVQDRPGIAEQVADYLAAAWPETGRVLYADSVAHSLDAGRLPVWYLLFWGDKAIGCAGLVANDFNSRQDLTPWLCALHVDAAHRGHNHAALLIQRAKQDAAAIGFPALYLSTDHKNYYERFGFAYLATG